MKSTIDSAGRLVIPKAIRRAAGLTPNMALDVRCHEGVIEIEPAPSPVVLERRGRFVIATPARPAGKLTSETVERTRRRVRRGETPEPEIGESGTGGRETGKS
jgi:AbrB family looped-hinge helix DNA binding protein